MWATPDAEFAHAQCKVWNDWAWETFGKYNDRMSPMAAIATADVNAAIEEIERVAKMGFRGLTLPCKPIFGAHDARHPNYNLPMYDPMWAVIQDADMPITFHVSTGRDPRAARKDGGAVINYVSHSLVPTIEPVANLCGSGVLERFPESNSPRSSPASDGSRGLSKRWTRPTSSITCGRCRSSRSCRASISARMDPRRSRKIRSASISR